MAGFRGREEFAMPAGHVLSRFRGRESCGTAVEAEPEAFMRKSETPAETDFGRYGTEFDGGYAGHQRQMAYRDHHAEIDGQAAGRQVLDLQPSARSLLPEAIAAATSRPGIKTGVLERKASSSSRFSIYSIPFRDLTPN